MEPIKITACAPPRCSCPVLEVEDNVLYITDDYGAVVQMTPSEFEILATQYMLQSCHVKYADA